MPSVQIIDDDEDICREIAFFLNASGYPCSWSTSLMLADPAWKENADVLVLDLWMPGTDGFQVIEDLAKSERKPRLIVASGHDERIMRAAVRRAEVGGLRVLGALQKPYDLQSLIVMIKSDDLDGRQSPNCPSPQDNSLLSARMLTANVRTAFQSKRRLLDDAIVGFEALLRVDLLGQPIMPETIFGDRVDLDTQISITQLVLKDAMRQAAALRAMGQPLPISVNFTPSILCSPDLPVIVMKMLEDWELPASLLSIEITEHETLHTFSELAAAVSRFALRSCGISLDDYGRGGTSLERLVDLPLTELKIDKNIFWECVEGHIPSSMLAEIILYCKRRGIASIIEGIETPDHRDFAISLGAELGQGFHWDRPAVMFGPLQ